MLFLDLDEFGDYNHLYGDTAGDTCLKAVAHTLAGGLRGQDQVFRKGGEEFVALLPGADTPTALATGERLRAAVQALAIEHTGNHPGVVTVTVAVAATDPATPPAEAREQAANAVYRAKLRHERNRVHPPPPDPHTRSGATGTPARGTWCHPSWRPAEHRPAASPRPAADRAYAGRQEVPLCVPSPVGPPLA